jgi:hypothetical protein
MDKLSTPQEYYNRRRCRGSTLQEYFQFSTAKCISTGAQYVTLKKKMG